MKQINNTDQIVKKNGQVVKRDHNCFLSDIGTRHVAKGNRNDLNMFANRRLFTRYIFPQQLAKHRSISSPMIAAVWRCTRLMDNGILIVPGLSCHAVCRTFSSKLSSALIVS